MDDRDKGSDLMAAPCWSCGGATAHEHWCNVGVVRATFRPDDECECCEFLGDFREGPYLVGDLWFCDFAPTTPTVTIAVGHGQFRVLAEEGESELPWFIEAMARAKKKELV